MALSAAPGRAGEREPVPLGEFDIACGVLVGRSEHIANLSSSDVAVSARQAMEDVVRRGLERPPCFVSFSGGRDSSAMLALAARIAVRDGLAAPVPVTSVFPGAEEAEETEWQEAIVRHVGIDDWVRLPVGDELDAVGPVAGAVLRRHGVLYPYNSHFHVPLLEVAAGGSLITGVGGDELMSPMVWSRATDLLHRAGEPTVADVVRLAVAIAPLSLRRLAIDRRYGFDLPWLRPSVRKRFRVGFTRWFASQPMRFDQALLRWWWPSRFIQQGLHSLGLLADTRDVQLVQPFCDPSVYAAVARQRGATGFRSRAHATETLFGDVLPAATVARESKATFGAALYNRHTREFVDRWDGTGVPSTLVDVDRLRQQWLRRAIDGRSCLLLQQAWLASTQPDGPPPA